MCIIFEKSLFNSLVWGSLRLALINTIWTCNYCVAVVEYVFYMKTRIVRQLHKADHKEKCALITASTLCTCVYSLQHVYPSNHVAIVEQWLLGRC